eukprot:CAMPEP_0167751062 /NCGR_PEP_ID=MMETSP0110_2-20121227/6350_1 /TAXON_ID=629695 /ORGANISM="Gymnochlora sp., Strain CCMP2014" /LENGTH=180 /DNA_ID=CAMNT_0007636477 /DNA_START=942 /DNA_END=1487 /DNA_ORIENTATION=-
MTQISSYHNQYHYKVVSIDAYESPKTKEKFNALIEKFKKENKSVQTIWVMHGTRAENVEDIMCNGFKIGGRETKSINGTANGFGVYTSTYNTPPVTYGLKGNSKLGSVILSKAVIGKLNEGECTIREEVKYSHDTYSYAYGLIRQSKKLHDIKEGLYVFRSSAQLLPKYVIRFERPRDQR